MQCSQVFVVRRSLDILDVGLLLNLDATVSQFLVADGFLTILHFTLTLPVPVEASDILQTGHLLVGQVGEDLDHVTTVTIDTIDVVLDKVVSPDSLLEEQRTADEATEDPLGLKGISVDNFLYHYNFKL